MLGERGWLCRWNGKKGAEKPGWHGQAYRGYEALPGGRVTPRPRSSRGKVICSNNHCPDSATFGGRLRFSVSRDGNTAFRSLQKAMDALIEGSLGRMPLYGRSYGLCAGFAARDKVRAMLSI
jgi:hypothetical protein